MLDYEVSLRSALVSVSAKNNTNITLLGCFFHFVQCIVRRIRCNHFLRQIYNSDSSTLKKFVSKFFALAFLNSNSRVLFAFKHLVIEYMQNNKDEFQCKSIQIFIKYLWKQYLKSDDLMNQWSVRDAGTHRTNNDVESFNRIFNIRIGAHPNMWRFIEGLQSLQDEAEARLVQQSIGGQHIKTPSRLQQRQKEEKISIFRLMLKENRISVHEFVNNISSIYIQNIDLTQNEDDDEEEDAEQFHETTDIVDDVAIDWLWVSIFRNYLNECQ
jgi:hypothetical protein